MMSNTFGVNSREKLELLLGYKFNNVLLLQEALSHPSLKQDIQDQKIYLKNREILSQDLSTQQSDQWPLAVECPPQSNRHLQKPIYNEEFLGKTSIQSLPDNYRDYERLEFLGDAILNFIITEILFKKFSKHNEGGLAKIKAFLVSKEVLNKISSKLSLSEFIIMTKGEEISGGRNNPSNIENAMEALIAAIYLDSDIANTKAITERLWQDHMHDFDYDTVDPKTSLQEWSQKHKGKVPKYEVTKKSGPDHSPIFTIKCAIDDLSSEASAKSIKEAQKLAAKHLLSSVKKIDI